MHNLREIFLYQGNMSVVFYYEDEGNGDREDYIAD